MSTSINELSERCHDDSTVCLADEKCLSDGLQVWLVVWCYIHKAIMAEWLRYSAGCQFEPLHQQVGCLNKASNSRLLWWRLQWKCRHRATIGPRAGHYRRLLNTVNVNGVTFSLSLMDPLPRMDILVSVSSCNLFSEFPRGPRSFPTKLNCRQK